MVFHEFQRSNPGRLDVEDERHTRWGGPSHTTPCMDTMVQISGELHGRGRLYSFPLRFNPPTYLLFAVDSDSHPARVLWLMTGRARIAALASQRPCPASRVQVNGELGSERTRCRTCTYQRCSLIRCARLADTSLVEARRTNETYTHTPQITSGENRVLSTQYGDPRDPLPSRSIDQCNTRLELTLRSPVDASPKPKREPRQDQ